MSRIGYSDEEDFSGQFALWRSNVNRSLLGKRGQHALRDLREALLALSEKRLISHAIANEDGEVCAIGAAIVYKLSPEQRATELKSLAELDEYEETTDYAPKDYPRLMAWAIVEANDMDFEAATPEERYIKMLAWIDARLEGKKLTIW